MLIYRRAKVARPSRPHFPVLLITTTGLCAFVMLGLLAASPVKAPLLVALAGVAVTGMVFGLRDPVVATMYLLVATFFRLAIPPNTLPVDPFLLAFAGVVVAVWVWPRPRPEPPAGLTAIHVAMALYVLWNLISIAAPHFYAAGSPLDDTTSPFSMKRFVVIGVIMPLTMFLVGRRVFGNERAARCLLWAILVAAAYSAAVSILQFTGPTSLVWPRYIVDSPNWVGRANGVFNQPVVNGLVLLLGFVVAALIASHRAEPRHLRVLAGAIGVACVAGIYLTHTRAEWLSFAVVVIIAAAAAKGFRTGFVLTAVAMLGTVVVFWSTLTSADRAAGGVGSASEVEDRMNIIATGVWAVEQHPIFGWGLGRFASINTYHHQQWSSSIPWERGYGYVSHLDSLGIFAELGIVGLLLWVTLFALIIVAVVKAYRRSPPEGQYNRPFVMVALLALIAQLVTGTTVDLRYFDFPNIIVMMLAGAAIGMARERRLSQQSPPDLTLTQAPPDLVAADRVLV